MKRVANQKFCSTIKRISYWFNLLGVSFRIIAWNLKGSQNDNSPLIMKYRTGFANRIHTF